MLNVLILEFSKKYYYYQNEDEIKNHVNIKSKMNEITFNEMPEKHVERLWFIINNLGFPTI